MSEDAATADRAVGVLLGLACGDALGVPYEFGPLLAADAQPEMKGGGLGNFAPGEWNDDNSMAVAVAEGLLSGGTLDDRLDAIALRFLDWYADDPADMGVQTRAVLGATARQLAASQERPGPAMRAEAAAYSSTNPHSAGNGALMRTAPVALAYLDDREECARAARAVAELTHADPLAGDSCVLCTEAIRAAVAGEGLELLWGLDLLPPERAREWRSWIEGALSTPVERYTPNGFTRTALQAAWGSVKHGRILPGEVFATAIRIGDDTDTVAAIAGSMAGAYRGEAALSSEWLLSIHGWPGLRASGLADLAMRLTGLATASPPAEPAPPHTVTHPHDDHVSFGNAAPPSTTAIVDLRIGPAPHPDFADRIVVPVWYLPEREPLEQEPWLAAAAEAIRDLRAQGHLVHVHFPVESLWLAGVAMAYSTRLGVDVHSAWQALSGPWPWSRSWEVLYFAVRDLAVDHWGVPANST